MELPYSCGAALYDVRALSDSIRFGPIRAELN